MDGRARKTAAYRRGGAAARRRGGGGGGGKDGKGDRERRAELNNAYFDDSCF